ncbi:Ohr family peroxiredoxin [Streptomyces sp. URMC 125]|uniref:Ohr family peroxiredoxin n=1 Tax=Streptomyces sp. URMC 125 TaxID=3423419 RepID=UPI003F1D1A34
MPVHSADVLHTAVATAGNGRDGRVSTGDGRLDLATGTPGELGGSGEGTNPEQLFAAGYGACFQSALALVARREKADVSGSTVTARVGLGRDGDGGLGRDGDGGLGRDGDGGFGLRVELTASLPDVDEETARGLLKKAHRVCPYSRAVEGNIGVSVGLA